LLIVINNRPGALTLPRVNLPALPNITIPITGLPDIQIPTARIPITIEPGTLVPQIGIAGTPVPEGALVLAPRTKTSGCRVNNNQPDPACTPGAVAIRSADVVCRPGFVSSSGDVSEEVRAEVYQSYNIEDPSTGSFRVDHLIPLSLGGSSELANLWPLSAAPRPGFTEKDQLEDYLHDQVCSGSMTLADAQRQFASGWVEGWERMPN
jgi:hypothetical protein